MAARRRFHPQRLYPRYAPIVAAAARVPGGLEAAVTLLSPIALDKQVVFSEDAKRVDLAHARVAIVGFPRTGTTFMQAAINTAFGDQAACWKNHDVLAIREFTRAGLPVFIPLRDPRDVIVSWMVYNKDAATPALTKQRIATYVAWHREALRRAQDALVTLIDLSDFERDPMPYLAPYLSSYDDPIEAPSLDSSAVATRLDQSVGEEVVSLEQKHVPSASRDALKPPYVAALASSAVAPDLSRALRLWDQMRSIRNGTLD